MLPLASFEAKTDWKASNIGGGTPKLLVLFNSLLILGVEYLEGVPDICQAGVVAPLAPERVPELELCDAEVLGDRSLNRKENKQEKVLH